MSTKTRRWKSEKPGYHQKTVMLRKCGKKCFLGKHNSFPICNKNSCKRNKKGVYSAYIRALQYRKKNKSYKRIISKARTLL